MRFRNLSLGTKLNLALLVFLLLLGAATSGIILYGFQRTQDNATERSRQALEAEGKLALQAVVGGASEQGGSQFESVAETGQRFARYLESFEQGGAPVPYDISSLARTDAGVYYDPNPNRMSDLVVLNYRSIADEAVQEDIAYSAPLDGIFNVLFEGFAGEISGRNFDPIAVVFISVNGVGRYYPPVGIQEVLPPDADVAKRMEAIGPVNNPERGTIWTAPYEDAAGQGQIVTARSPVYEGDTLRGSLEVDLSLNKLIDQLNGIQPTPRGFAFYVDSAGNLVRSKAYGLLTQDAANNPELAGILDAMKADHAASGVAVEKVELGGEPFFIAHAAVLSLGGSLAVASPVSDVTGEAATITAGIDDEGNRTFGFVLAAMAGLFVVGLAGAGYLNRRVLVQPIQQLAAATRRVAAGDLATSVDLPRGDELGALADSFNTMVAQLRSRSETLIEKESQYRSVFEATSDGLLLFTVDGALVEVNPACCEMHGYTREEFLQLRPASFIHQDDMLLFGDFVAAVAVGGEFRTRARDIRKDGSQFPIEVLGRPFASMGKTLLLAVIRDITEQVETERLLEERVEDRTRELDALLRADAELFRSLELDEVLQALVDVAVDLLGADKSLVTIWDRERGEAQLRASKNMSDESIELLKTGLTRSGHGSLPDDFDLIVHKGEPSPGMPQLLQDIARKEGTRVSVEIPIKSPARGVLGGFGIGYTRPHEFTEDDRRLFTALAERAAVAIENAELYKRAQQAASLEERQRLARELHDSVSQALYGIALGARTARTLIDTDPAKAAEPVDYVLSLAEAGLTEMRALIFELRPESLALEGVVAALDKQIAAARARHGLDITFESCAEPETSLEIKEAIYRIAQEALHNIVKHAKASHVDVRLQHTDAVIELVVSDDGVGFDPSGDFAGHLGLRSMRERAAKAGASLVVQNAPGAGTTIRFSAKAD